MRKFVAIAGCLLVVALVYTLAQAQQQQRVTVGAPAVGLTQIVPTVTAWEYRWQAFAETQLSQLNNIGNEGWELVTVQPSTQVGMQISTYIAFFKRPKMR
jgi:hypothetical protein